MIVIVTANLQGATRVSSLSTMRDKRCRFILGKKFHGAPMRFFAAALNERNHRHSNSGRLERRTIQETIRGGRSLLK